MPTVDTVLRDSLYLTDDAGTAITGADTNDFTSTATLMGSATTATVTVSEDANGFYFVDYTPDRLGVWRVVVEYDDGTTQRTFIRTHHITPQPFVGLSSGRPIRR